MIYMAAPKGLFPPEPEHYRGPKLKVAIIWAGLAGMSTAVELLDQGNEVWPILFYCPQMLTICLLCFVQFSNALIIPPFHHFFFFCGENEELDIKSAFWVILLSFFSRNALESILSSVILMLFHCEDILCICFILFYFFVFSGGYIRVKVFYWWKSGFFCWPTWEPHWNGTACFLWLL